MYQITARAPRDSLTGVVSVARMVSIFRVKPLGANGGTNQNPVVGFFDFATSTQLASSLGASRLSRKFFVLASLHNLTISILMKQLVLTT